MKTKKIFLLLFVMMSANAFADDAPIVSAEFPSDGHMLENHIYQNAAISENMAGVYTGSVYANATYSDLQVACNAGYYLPHDTETCELCLENNYCVGGTYTYSESDDQGMVACGDGLFAPAGAKESGACGRKFHVGEDALYLRSVKKTTPSLNFDMDHDGVAEFFGNMTTTSTYMNKDSTRYFRITGGDKDYYVCDDTTCPDAE